MTSILSTDDINLSFTQMSQKQGDANEYMLKIKNVSDNGAWENVQRLNNRKPDLKQC